MLLLPTRRLQWRKGIDLAPLRRGFFIALPLGGTALPNPKQNSASQRVSVAGEAGEGVAGVGLAFGELAGAAPVVAGGLSEGAVLGLLSTANNATMTIPETMPSVQSHIVAPPSCCLS
jgi:hypothetical protein